MASLCLLYTSTCHHFPLGRNSSSSHSFRSRGPNIRQVVHTLAPLVDQQRGWLGIGRLHPVGEEVSMITLVPCGVTRQTVGSNGQFLIPHQNGGYDKNFIIRNCEDICIWLIIQKEKILQCGAQSAFLDSFYAKYRKLWPKHKLSKPDLFDSFHLSICLSTYLSII